MSGLTHLDEAGAAHMVDVGGKTPTRREAVARGRIDMVPDAVRAIRDGSAIKGDVLAVARVAGIMGAKKTSDLIPLCHPLPLTRVAIDLVVDDEGVVATATAAPAAVAAMTIGQSVNPPSVLTSRASPTCRRWWKARPTLRCSPASTSGSR